MRVILSYHDQIELYVGLKRPDDIDVLGGSGTVEAPVQIPYPETIKKTWTGFRQSPGQKASVGVRDEIAAPIEMTWKTGERKLLGDYGIVVRRDEFERLGKMEPSNEFELDCDNSIGTRFGSDKVSIYVLDGSEKI